MLKVMTIVGTRPELIKMSRVISAFDRHTDHVLVHTGQNYDYELNQVFFEDLEIRQPDHFLEAVGDTTAQTIGRVIEKSDEIIGQVKPDAVLLYGDTNSCLAVISAKRRQVPVFHMEAGNRCFDQRVPEELNRKVLDHLSDINLVLTEHARRYLIAEGIRPETIIKTGSHMPEILEHNQEKIKASDVLTRLSLDEGRYFIVSAHREENVDSPKKLREFMETLHALAEKYELPVIVSTHPRTRKQLGQLGLMASDSRIQFLKPFGFCDYVKLQMGASCVLSDSGTITEEAAILGLPAVTLRQAHERPEGMDAGTLIMCGLEKTSVLDAIDIIIQQHDQLGGGSGKRLQMIDDFKMVYVSEKVVRIVESYVDYINRTVWFKT